jgi:hypothetical protein
LAVEDSWHLLSHPFDRSQPDGLDAHARCS